MEKDEKEFRAKVIEGIKQRLDAQIIGAEFERDWLKKQAPTQSTKKEQANVRLLAKGQQHQIDELTAKRVFLTEWQK